MKLHSLFSNYLPINRMYIIANFWQTIIFNIILHSSVCYFPQRCSSYYYTNGKKLPLTAIYLRTSFVGQMKCVSRKLMNGRWQQRINTVTKSAIQYYRPCKDVFLIFHRGITGTRIKGLLGHFIYHLKMSPPSMACNFSLHK